MPVTRPAALASPGLAGSESRPSVCPSHGGLAVMFRGGVSTTRNRRAESTVTRDAVLKTIEPARPATDSDGAQARPPGVQVLCSTMT
jgi:hypothetical protein